MFVCKFTLSSWYVRSVIENGVGLSVGLGVGGSELLEPSNSPDATPIIIPTDRITNMKTVMGKAERAIPL